MSAKIGNEVITVSKSAKLLGIMIDNNKFYFKENNSKFCKKVSFKLLLHAY